MKIKFYYLKNKSQKDHYFSGGSYGGRWGRIPKLWTRIADAKREQGYQSDYGLESTIEEIEIEFPS